MTHRGPFQLLTFCDSVTFLLQLNQNLSKVVLSHKTKINYFGIIFMLFKKQQILCPVTSLWSFVGFCLFDHWFNGEDLLV